APFQLKELVLDGTNLEEFPNSLERLSYLEDLVLTGRSEWNGSEWNNSMQIDGRYFSKSLKKLRKLKSLALRNLTLSGELTLNVSKRSVTGGSLTPTLEKIDMRDVKLVSRVSISEEYLRTLKSIHLDSLENLIEVDLGVVVEPATQQELARIGRIVIDGCWQLEKIIGLDKLKELKYLHISTANINYLRGYIEKRVALQVTSVIWRSSVVLDEGFFSPVIGP
ncbi:hypothetical protein KI387_019103, partial [Taxus chinensis]